MITPAVSTRTYRVYGNFTGATTNYALLVDRFGGTWYPTPAITIYSDRTEFVLPQDAFTSANLPGTLYLYINNTLQKTITVDLSTATRAAEVAATTFSDVFTTYSTTASTATVQITQGTYPNWDTITPATLWNNFPNIDYNGNISAWATDATYCVNTSAGIGTDILFKPMDIEFVHTGTTYFGFIIPAYGYVPDKVHVWVDELEVTGSPFTLTAVAQNTVTITLPNTAAHKIRLAGNLMHGYFATNSGGVVTAPTPRSKFAVIADSYWEGLTYNYYDAIPIWLRSYTGWKVINLAQQGTGFKNPYQNDARPFGADKRIAQVVGARPDALIVNGSVNDQQNYSIDEICAAQKQFYDKIKMALPKLPIIQILPEDSPWFQTNVGDPTALNAEMKATALAHSSVVGVIDPISENWIYGTGNTGAPNGSGNADSFITTDSVHPSPAGCKYMAKLVADRIARMPMANGN